MKLVHALGIGLPITLDGQRLWLRPVSWWMLGVLEAMRAGALLERVERASGKSGPETRRARLDAAARQIEQGEFSYDGKAARKALQEGTGFASLVWLMLGGDPVGQSGPPLELAERLVLAKPLEVSVRLRLLNPPGRERHGRRRKAAPPFETIAAVLVADPCGLTLEQVGQLTPYQTNEVYCHERDKKGDVQLPRECQPELNEDRSVALMEVAVDSWKRAGLSPDEIDAHWEQLINRMAGITPPGE